MRIPWRRSALVALAGLALAACGRDAPDVAAGGTPTAVELPAPDGAGWASTAGADGNHVAMAAAARATPTSTTVALPIAPAWVVSVPLASGGVLHALTDGDGGAAAVVASRAPDGTVTTVLARPEPLGTPPAGRPALVAVDGAWRWLDVATNGEPPVPLPDGRLGFVDTDGAVHLGDVVADEPALPDARLAVSADGRVAWLARPTDRYGHGVLGDDLEAEALVIADASTGEHVATVDVAPLVVEGIGVIWADVDEDGVDDVVMTLSAQGEGARIVVLRDELVAAPGDPIGSANRWRHQIAVAPGPDGHPEIVEVVMPHAARVAAWSVLSGERLAAVQTVASAVASHTLGSRDLDQAVVVDVTGDGVADLVAPAATGSGLGVVDRVTGDVVALAGGPVATNVTATALDDTVQVAAASGTTLHLWTW